MPEETQENHSTPTHSQNSWPLSQDMKPGPPKCEAGVLTTQSEHETMIKTGLFHPTHLDPAAW